MKCTACSKTFPMLYASSEGGLCYTCMQNHLVATAASPGPTTTPVEKREEDVATDVAPLTPDDIADAARFLRKFGPDCVGETKWLRIADGLDALAEPQPISNPLVCGRRQEALSEWLKAYVQGERQRITELRGIQTDTCETIADTLERVCDELEAEVKE